jgi:serine/threonine protein kinase
MPKGEYINGYQLTTDWKVVGGMSEVAFALKDGREWFIKKFISPKYPTDDSPGSERIKAQKRKNCDEFEKRHKELNRRIGRRCGLGGNLVYAYDFFRENTCYYKVTEKIDVSSIDISEICSLSHKDLMVVLKSLVHSLKIMHNENIVHGDLKPDNILIKVTSTGGYTAKLIDFDDSYFSQEPPKDKEQVVGTPEYYSPELFEYISDEEGDVPGDILTTKSDIFALGVIFVEYITGSKPIIPEKYKGTYTAVADSAEIVFKKSVHLTSKIESLLRKMLALRAEDRPSIDEVFNELRNLSAETSTSVVESIDSEMKILKFSSKIIDEEKIELEWEVLNAQEVRIDDGLPVVKKGNKRRRLLGMIVGAIQGVVFAFVTCVPVCGLANEINKLSEVEVNGSSIIPVEFNLSELEESQTYKLYNSTGDWFYKLLTSKKTEDGTDVSVSDTIDIVIVTTDVVKETTNLATNLEKVSNADSTPQDKVDSLKGVGDSLINIGNKIDSLTDSGKELLKDVISGVVSSFVGSGEGEGSGEG